MFAACQSAALAQVDSTTVDSVALDSATTDTLFLYPPELPDVAVDITSLNTGATDTLFRFSLSLTAFQDTTVQSARGEKKKELFKVNPWEFHAPLGAERTATDSTLRWQYWSDWTYKLNREPGVISYRLGTNIRSNAVQRNAHEPRHQQLYWEDISLNDPVSGIVNWELIPQNKIADFYTDDLGTVHESRFYHHQYYINKPLSRLIYSESQFNYRNLEFEISHNLSQRTNIELSYWDRRSGGEYKNSEITGRQIYLKASHHLDQNKYLKLNYITNNYDIGQPFGYSMNNMLAFNFDRYSASPVQSSATTEQKNNILTLNYYQRNPDSTQTEDNFRAGLFQRSDERLMTSTSDSTGYSLKSVGANARKWWQWGGLHLETGAKAEYSFNQTPENNTLPAENWATAKADGSIVIDFVPLIDLMGDAELQMRSDGFQSYQMNAEGKIPIGDFSVTVGASSGTIMPTPQQLYWDSDQFKGNSDLENEKVQDIRGTLSYHFNPDTEIGIRGQHKEVTDGIMVADSLFTNVNNYASQSATAFFEWDLTNFEFEGSAVFHRFADSYVSPSGTIPMSPQERVWLKGSAYWKGYLFDRATYVKAGVSGMAAPFRYQPDHYNPELNYWQPMSADQQLPRFNRLDVDISARVRSIMFILRWENVLDDVSQLGYFETAQYPMAQRRFIFSVRALFRN
ncbi:hypothetical protein CK503_00655 [Aliifodinibius salipaludis]|uniref:TonB-dependent receptor-like beta-barrel domain-containing protein n=2 Tax=Fodinibius salipaludis TaxID=2032627 RepID=A0A2A2GFE5_9BACT|nr:hypothetical protein CK503_00655 [Aliifodinibius salipaludis]